MFSSIYILRYGIVLLPIFSKPLFKGINSIPRFYTTLCFLVISISEVVEFCFVSMSMLSRCEVILEFLPIILANYVLVTNKSFVLLSIMCTLSLFVALWSYPCYRFFVSSQCPIIKFLIVIILSKVIVRYCICRCSEGFGFECYAFFP